MSNNKNKVVSKNTTDKNKKVQNVQVSNNKEVIKNNSKKDTKVKEDITAKEETKVTSTPPPADPTVIETKVEEVVKEVNSSIPKKVDLNSITLSTSQRLTGDGYARMLDVAERYISRMKPGEASTIKMEQAFTYSLAWGITKMSIQAREEKIEYGLNVPNDDVIVNDVISTFNNLGVALSPHVSDDGKQTTLKFEEIDETTEKEAKEEIKQEKTKVIPESDPEKWTNEEDAKKGLIYVLTRNNKPFPDRFNETLYKVRLFKKSQETDPEKKKTWDEIGIGSLFEDAVVLLGNRSTALVRGLCQGSVSSLITDHNPIFAHSQVKYNLPILSEEDIADLIKSFIKVQNTDPKVPLDESLAVKNGILEATREMFLNVPIDNELPADSSMYNEEKLNDIKLSKKIMRKFNDAYGSEIGLDDPKYFLHVTNKMIEIRNLYVDKSAAYSLYTEDEYPKAS